MCGSGEYSYYPAHGRTSEILRKIERLNFRGKYETKLEVCELGGRGQTR